MKQEKKKKRVITRPHLIIIIFTAVITAVITQLTTGLISSVYRFTKDQVWPPKLQLKLTELIIYRTNLEDFPTCEMNIVINNPSDKLLSAELREVRLFRDHIVHRFPRGEQVVKVRQKDLDTKHVEFRDQVLDLALKVPQDSSTAMIKLIFEYAGTNSRDSLVFGDADVIKCTYWQVPLFQSETEAMAIGAVRLRVKKTISWTDSLTGDRGETQLAGMVFTDRQGQLDFNGRKAGEKSWNLQIHLSDSSAFRRRYGGVYRGCLASDSLQSETLRPAYEVLGDPGDYYQYGLVGMTYEHDISSVIEFIHYSFDPARQDELFRSYEENSHYYILLLHEHSCGIAAIIDSLKKRGYHAGSDSVIGFMGFLDNLTRVAPVERLSSLVEVLNTHLDSLNSVINSDGFFLFSPLVIERKKTVKILSDLHKATGKPHTAAFSFDCRPFKSRRTAAPFCTPLLVFLNFSDETMKRTLNSIKTEYFLSP